MGAAGDMLMAALWELVPDKQVFIDKMNSIGLPGVRVEASDVIKSGVKGTHMKVTVYGEEELSLGENDHVHEEHQHDHHHTGVKDVYGIIDAADVPSKVKKDAKAVYAMLADAESRVHGESVEQIHFHEVGTLDSVADVLGVCLLMDMIGAEKTIVSPVHVGSGFVRCAHGVLPVPAPATALLLEGVPSYGGSIEGELCTPTGAALLKYYADGFGNMPVMSSEKIGYGMGTKEFERLSCVRAFLGESAGGIEKITKLECNIDDMTGEDIGFAMNMLLKEGARDVYTQNIGMKKSRPGIMLSVLCLPEDADKFAALIMKYTSTIGIRRLDLDKYLLPRHTDEVETGYGTVRVKTSEGMGVKKSKAEYDDLAKIAEENGVSLDDIRKAVLKASEEK